MRALPWMMAGIGAGIAATYLMMNQPQMRTAAGYDSVEEGAARTYGWGSKARLTGMGRNVAGKVKEGFGRVTGNASLANEGVGDQAIGTAKDAVGTVAQAAGQTIHDLTR